MASMFCVYVILYGVYFHDDIIDILTWLDSFSLNPEQSNDNFLEQKQTNLLNDYSSIILYRCMKRIVLLFKYSNEYNDCNTSVTPPTRLKHT